MFRSADHAQHPRADVDTVQHDLQKELARRQQQKAEMERQLHAVRQRYQEEVAPLKETVLRLQVEQLRRAAQRHMRSARHRNAYHDAQRAYETFQERQLQPDAIVVDDLKERYRQASKKCHPDVVSEAFREQAVATFQALESAYEAGHTRAVRAIADALDQWGFPTGPSSEEWDSPPSAADLRRAISDLDSAIESIRATDAYQVADETEDLDALLQARKEELLRHLRRLRNR